MDRHTRPRFSTLRRWRRLRTRIPASTRTTGSSSGRFWATVLGLELVDRGDGVASLRGATPRHTVWITEVPEPRTVKNRMHLDVHTGSVDDLLALGATVVEELPHWTVMADPEGNEFCVFPRS